MSALAAESYAQTTEGRPVIGWLYATTIASGRHLEHAFLQGLREHGYTEGNNVIIERRWADGKSERIPAMAAELVQLKVNVIYAPTPPDALAAHQATKSIPIVFALMGDPVSTGIAKSLARPGGNMTGLSTVNTQLVTKRYALLKDVAPKMKRVATLYDPTVHENVQFLETAKATAKELDITVIPVAAARAEDFEAAFESVKKIGADALLVIANPLFFSYRQRITALAAATRLPAMYGRTEFVEAGGLLGYSVDGADQARRAAGYVARILKGADPAELPIEQPTKFELHVNVATAKALGLRLPRSILVRADRIFE
jgi:putative ABC transport system substrate-binding protein